MKPYQNLPIEDCGEPLVSIPLENFAVQIPHPYEKLGAEYGEKSPYCLRQGVLEALAMAQFLLNKSYPGWKLKLYDAYRPIGVQQFMVDYTFDSLLKQSGWEDHSISAQQRQKLWEQVYQLWAAPSTDPTMPPPHSTGAAIDLTLVDQTGKTVAMGGEIDELSPRSHPEYYANSRKLTERQYHRYRQVLNQVMTNVGFYRHPEEWWHFSLGDQMWAWLYNQKNPAHPTKARYGRV
ncbi:MAG TPA: M15 family metallopeptidase [Xenococcaceae cyanobacterium]